MEITKLGFTSAAAPTQSGKRVQTVSAFSEQLAALADSAVTTSELPDSKGVTEVNIAWLLQKYSDKEVISWDERIELFDTMRQLGILDDAQYDRAMAVCPGLKVAPASQAGITIGPLLSDSIRSGGWTISFADYSIPASFLEQLRNVRDWQEVQMWLDALEQKDNWSCVVREMYYDSHGNLLGSTLR